MIGNKYQNFKDSHVACISCGIDAGLFQVAHRNREGGPIVGYIFTCEQCFSGLVGKHLILSDPL